MDAMNEEALAYKLDAASSDEVKLWLGNLHEALEKQPARELFDKFSRDTTVRLCCVERGIHAPFLTFKKFKHIMHVTQLLIPIVSVTSDTLLSPAKYEVSLLRRFTLVYKGSPPS